MKRQVKASLVLALILAVGCASLESTAYKTAGSLAVTVEQARQAYVQLYDAGKISPQVKATVEKAYADYQKAMALLQIAITVYRADKNAPPLQAAIDGVAAAGASFLKAAQP